MPRIAFTAICPLPLLAPPPHTLVQRRYSTMSLLKGRNVVVTGATRGIGRGIAIALGEQGANVYITGRTKGPGPGSLEELTERIREVGGNCDYFVVDHSDDKQIEDLFAQLTTRLAANGSKLDFFVNNAYSAVHFITDSAEVPFWKKNVKNPSVPDPNSNPGDYWDCINGVGLRNNFICSTRAIRMMEPHGSGMIINITSWGGMVSLFDPVYSTGKQAMDRMSAELALAAPEGVKSIAFCPGFVTTDAMLEIATKLEAEAQRQGQDQQPEILPLWNAESPRFVGKVLAALLSEKGEPLWDKMNGKVVIAAEVADVLDVNEDDGFRPLSFRSVRYFLMSQTGFLIHSPLRRLVPRTLKASWPAVWWAVGATKYWN